MVPTKIVDCVVRNISANGALLEFNAAALVPNPFQLTIKPQNMRRSCEVIRRGGLHMRVRFVSGR
jgi:hypothetical protein